MTYDSTNIFAKILRGELPCKKVYESEYILAFYDIYPVAPVHVIVIPKLQSANMQDFIKNQSEQSVVRFFQEFDKVIQILDLKNGYRIITNKGKDGMQTVEHFHLHILGGKELGALVSK